MAKSGARAVYESATNRYWDDIVCRWDKARGRNLADFKRISARTARRILARDLRNWEAEYEDAPRRDVNRRKKKLLARWCRGKVGQEHIVTPWTYYEVGNYRLRTDACARCGKRYWQNLRREERVGRYYRPDPYPLYPLRGSTWQIVKVTA